MMAKSIAAAIHQRQLTDQLAYQANHDALTGLPNRLMLQRELDLALQKAAKTGESLAVVFIDLDRFKQINDTLGHEVGDVVLQQIARRLQERTLPGNTLARMGGDEFTAILTGADATQSAEEYAQGLLAAVRMPCRAGTRELFVTASVGISLYPRDGADGATLLRNADSAMYTAKYRTKNDLHSLRWRRAPIPESGSSWRHIFDALWNVTNSKCSISRKWIFRAGWQAWRRCWCGTAPNSAGLLRLNSFLSRKIQA